MQLNVVIILTLDLWSYQDRMDDEILWRRLTDLFKATLENESIVLGPGTTAEDVDGWNSLTHVQLILAVEAEFKLKFRHEEIASFENVGDLINAVKRRSTGE